MIKGEVVYKTDTCTYRKVTKPNFTHRNMKLIEVEKGVSLKPLKVRVVAKLLSKHFGDDWRKLESLQFYNQLERKPINTTEDPSEDDNQGVVVQDEEDDSLEVV